MKRTVSRDIFLQCHFLADEIMQKEKHHDSITLLVRTFRVNNQKGMKTVFLDVLSGDGQQSSF
jgi:hypothetical protein